jgi:cation transport protein ChaC
MGEPLWVFAYGSLMWQPGFRADARHKALLRGLHRAFCVVSHVHRGTPDRPGLVAGLDLGGACRGLALRVASGEEAAVLDYLRSREQPTMVYRETVRPVEIFADGGASRGRVNALCFVVDRRHHQYCGRLSLQDQCRMVVSGVGQSGRSIDYLEDMMACLERLGIHDRGVERLARSARARAAGA